MTTARSALALLMAMRSCCEPALACPTADRGVQSLPISAGCPAPFDGVLHTQADEDIRAATAARAADALDASSEKIRKLQAAAKAVPDPPSRLEWFLYGAASAILAAGSVALYKGAK